MRDQGNGVLLDGRSTTDTASNRPPTRLYSHWAKLRDGALARSDHVGKPRIVHFRQVYRPGIVHTGR